MTAMQQIEIISVEARKRGMKYGEYVAKFGDTLPKPEVGEKQGKSRLFVKRKKGNNTRVELVCEVCGGTFKAGRKGAKFCPECARIRRDEWFKEYRAKRKRK